MHSTPKSIQIQYCKNEEMYSQIYTALRNFVENSEVTKEQYVSPSSKSLRDDEQCLILQKAEELLELLKDKKIKSYSESENLHDCSEDSTSSDASNHDCVNMSLTLEDLKLNYTTDLDTTTSDMELTCMDSTFPKTPTATVKSILKSAQMQKSESGRRRVRFEDELEETMAEIIENKENLNWRTNVTEVRGLKEAVKADLPSICETRSHRQVSRGKTVKTLKILGRKHKPRNSPGLRTEGESVDLKALREIKTLVEIEKEGLEESDFNGYRNDDHVVPKCDGESIKTEVLSTTENSLRLSFLPGDLSDLDIPGFLLTCC